MSATWWFEGDHDPGRGDVGVLLTLQRHLGETAAAAAAARRDLLAIADQVDGTVWTGEAAEAFRHEAGLQAVCELAALERTSAEAAQGLAAYVAAVDEIAEIARTLRARIVAAQDDYEASVRRLWALAPDGVVLTGSLEAPAFGEGFPARVLAGSAPGMWGGDAIEVDVAQRQVDESWADLQVLYRRMHALQTHDRVLADAAVVEALTRASEHHVRTSRGWARFWLDVEQVATTLGVAVLVVAAAVLLVSFAVGLAVAVGGAGLWAGAGAVLATSGSAMAVGGSLTVGATSVATGTALAVTGATAGALSLTSHAALSTSSRGQVAIDALAVVPGLPGVSRGALAARSAIAHPAPPQTLRMFTSSDPLVGDVANAIERALPGRVRAVNVLVPQLDGKEREIDILVGDIAIQVKSGRGRRLFEQVRATAAKTALRPLAYSPT